MKTMKEPCSRKLFQECGLLILVHTFEPSAVETQVGGFQRVWGHSSLHSEFQDSQGNIGRHCQITKQTKRICGGKMWKQVASIFGFWNVIN